MPANQVITFSAEPFGVASNKSTGHTFKSAPIAIAIPNLRAFSTWSNAATAAKVTKTSNRPRMIGPIISGVNIQINAGVEFSCSLPARTKSKKIAKSATVAKKTNPTVFPANKYPARNTTAASGGYCHIGSLIGKNESAMLPAHQSYRRTSLNRNSDSG